MSAQSYEVLPDERAAARRYQLASWFNIVPGLGSVYLGARGRDLLLPALCFTLEALLVVAATGENTAGQALLLFLLLVALALWPVRANAVHVYYRNVAPRYAVRRAEHVLAQAAIETQPCPRCERAPRTPSGWCADCFAALRRHPLAVDHPVAGYLSASADRRDRDALAFVADRVSYRTGSGPAKVVKRAMNRSASGATRAMYPDYRFELLGAFADPSDPTAGWSVVRFTGFSSVCGVGLSTENVTQYHTANGLIRGIRVYAPMPARHAAAAPPTTWL